MKIRHLLLVLFLLPLFALWGCEGDEGPAGPAGADGADGADGIDGLDGANGYTPAMCLDCHNTAEDLEVQLSYAQSGHKAGLYVDYAGGRSSCARCHSKQGFIEFMVTGDVSANVPDPASIDCATCHIVHPDEDAFSLRVTDSDPVDWIYDEEGSFDFEDNSNICATCHQSRRAEPNVSDPGETFEITSTHYGPHHGAMGNVYAGEGFAEIPGSMSYEGVAPHFSLGITCVDCHMGDYDGENTAGGHSWWPSLASCTPCHAGASDFDIGGVQTDTQDLLDQLRDLLLDQGVIEWVEEDEAYEPIVGTYPMAQAQAFFNWIGLTEDRSLGVHNPPYVEALLTNTIEAIE